MKMRLSFSRALALLFALPVFAHAHVLLGFLLADPIYRFGGLGTNIAGWLPGQPTIDPNVAGIDQALTTRAIDTIFSGALPWWNSFEGLGQPLAGEMQSSALFPFSVLLALPNGTLLIDLVLSMLSGVGMLLLLRRLGLRVEAAFVGAVAYQMCGTFSWLSGAWSYPIAWLPFLVLGIELSRSSLRRESRFAIVLVALSIALLLYSGFIETAYLEGLAATAWSVARFFTGGVAGRSQFVGRLLAGASLGLALGSPILIAFVDFLAMSYAGGHRTGYAGRALVPWAMLQKIMPYIYGPIFASHQDPLGLVWGNTGGYVGFALPALAIAGLFGRRHIGIRMVCALIVAVGFAAIFGGPLQAILMLVPGVKYTAFYRYIDPAIAFATCVLVASAIEDVYEDVRSVRLRLLVGLVTMLVIVALIYPAATPELASPAALTVDAGLLGWHWFSFAATAVALASIAFGAFTRKGWIAAAVVGTTVCVETIVFLVIPTFSYPSSATISLGGVHYLQHNLGEQRFYSLGPIGPNYGSYFGIADLDYADLPIPAETAVFVRSIDPTRSPNDFFAGSRGAGPMQAETFGTRIDSFARVGVKYLLVPKDTSPPVARLHARFSDSLMAIYEVPNTRPYFSAKDCTVLAASRGTVRAKCRVASTLCRLELNAPGWQAEIDGKKIIPSTCDNIFQSIPLPAGYSTIEFRFVPPHMLLGFLLFAISLSTIAALLTSLFLELRRKVRQHAPAA